MANVEQTACTKIPAKKRPILILGVILLCHALLVTWMTFHNSANPNEPAHLAAGIYDLRYGRFEIYRVNPPLSRMIAAIPATWMFKLEADWLPSASQVLGHRAEFLVGGSLFKKNDPHVVFCALAFGRLMLLPLSLFGAWICYRWASELFGYTSGYLASVLWCFSPTILTWAATVGPDLASATFGVFGFYSFWRWCREPVWGRAFLAGVGGGLMLLSKTTWLILVIAWPLIGYCYLPRTSWFRLREACKCITQLVAILLLAILVLDAGYCFAGFGRRLNTFTFVSCALAGKTTNDDPAAGNRFATSWIGYVPTPLPEDYVIGIDLQKRDFEQGMPSYLNGEWSAHGWWYYYLYALAVKTPLGTWCLVLLALATSVWGEGCSASWRDEMFALAPFFIVLILVSSQTGFSVHYRYIVPALPFLFIWASKAARVLQRCPFRKKQFALASLTVFALAWSVYSVLLVYPHTLSYFNEFAGGPHGGPTHLLGSNVDWEQDMYYLETWYKAHLHARPFGLVYSGVAPLDVYEIHIDNLPPRFDEERGGLRGVAASLQPGWYALSVNTLYSKSKEYQYFLRFSPATTIGYSTHIYHVLREDVDRFRLENNLPSLDAEEQSQSILLSRFAGQAKKKRGCPIRAAIFGDNGSSRDCIEAIERQLASDRFICKTIMGSDISKGTLQDVDVIIFPGGHSIGQWQSLGPDGAKAVRSFVHSGGGYLGICAGAVLATVNREKGIGLINADMLSDDSCVPRIGATMSSSLGEGMVSVELTSYGCSVFGGGRRRMEMLYSGGPVLLPGSRTDMPAFMRLALFQSDLFRYDCQRGTMLGTPAIIVAPYGNGAVLAISPHPELTVGLEHLIPKAIEMLASSRSTDAQHHGTIIPSRP